MNRGVNWQSISDIYIEDAGYFRLQNLTVGYDFKNIWKNCPFQQLRLYFAAQNLSTITDYKGMDPEMVWHSTAQNLGLLVLMLVTILNHVPSWLV